MALDQGGGGGGATTDTVASDGPFDHYPASVGAIMAQADEIASKVGAVNGVKSGVQQQKRTAEASASGSVKPPISGSSKPVDKQAAKIAQVAVFASGCIRFWGKAVKTFNKGVDKLNAEYKAAAGNDFGVTKPQVQTGSSLPAAKLQALETSSSPSGSDDTSGSFQAQVDDARSALLAELKRRYGKLEDKLDAKAKKASSMLEKGPDDEKTVRALFGDGLLPISATKIFPGYKLKLDKLPYDVRTWSTRRLVQYLARHRKLLKNSAFMQEVKRRVELLTGKTGAKDATSLRAVVEKWSKRDVGAADDALANLSLIGIYADHIQERGGALPDGAASYLRSFFQEVGEHNGKEDITLEIPKWIKGREDALEAAVPGYESNNWMMKGYANSILAASDGRLHSSLGKDAISDSVWDAIDDIPEEVSRANPVTGNPIFQLSGGADFKAFAELMGHASLEPSYKMAEEMNDSVGELAGLLQKGLHGNSSYVGYEQSLESLSPLMENVVSVASSNEHVSAQLLHDAAEHPNSEQAEHLRDLYSLEWSDDGSAVSGYTDWIPEEAASGDKMMALRGSADLINFITSTNAEDDSLNTFKLLMRGAGSDGDDSVGDVNPELAQAFGRVAASNLDALGEPPIHDETRVDGDLDISLDGREKLLTLIATDNDPSDPNDAASTLSRRIGAYEQARLLDALDKGGDLSEIGEEAARLDGYMGGAMMNAGLVEEGEKYDDGQKAYNEHRLMANAGKVAVTTALSFVPGAGPVLAGGAELIASEAINAAITEPLEPGGVPVDASSEELYYKSMFRYAQAVDESSQELPRGIRDMLYNEDGTVREPDELSDDEFEDFRKHFENESGFNEYSYDKAVKSPTDPRDDAAIDNEGQFHKNVLDAYLKGTKRTVG